MIHVSGDLTKHPGAEAVEDQDEHDRQGDAADAQGEAGFVFEEIAEGEGHIITRRQVFKKNTSASLRGAFFATKQSQGVTEIAS